GKTLLHGDVLMWLMKTLLTSGCTNQRGAGQILDGEMIISDIQNIAKYIHVYLKMPTIAFNIQSSPDALFILD
ncbi:hypothetical protein, partial [Klebsiella pneumoniae]